MEIYKRWKPPLTMEQQGKINVFVHKYEQYVLLYVLLLCFFRESIGFISILFSIFLLQGDRGKASAIRKSIYRDLDEILCDADIASSKDPLHMKNDVHHCVLCTNSCLYIGYMRFCCL